MRDALGALIPLVLCAAILLLSWMLTGCESSRATSSAMPIRTWPDVYGCERSDGPGCKTPAPHWTYGNDWEAPQ